MIVAITSSDLGPDSPMDSRFGRCPCFVFADTEAGSFEGVANPSLELSGGAGIQSARFVAERGAKVVLTGHCGPKAYRALRAAGVEVFVGCSGSPRTALEAYASGSLEAASGPDAQGHAGLGGGAR